jgi:hypothetical protein
MFVARAVVVAQLYSTHTELKRHEITKIDVEGYLLMNCTCNMIIVLGGSNSVVEKAVELCNGNRNGCGCDCT